MSDPGRSTPLQAGLDPDREEVRAHTQALASDLRQWLEWAALTGAIEVPSEPVAAPEPRIPAQQPAARPPAPPVAPGRAPSSPGDVSTGQRPPAAAPPPRAAPSTPAPRVSPRAASASSAPPPPTGEVARGEPGLTQVRAELGDCQRCRLAKDRRQIVFGVGSPTASLMLIGEAPGQQEDLTGEPFVGRAGQLLTRMLAAIGLTRDEVYICNVIKCRPPQNRDPLADELASCVPFVHRQVAAVGPKVIMTLGRFAAVNLVGVDAPMGELRKTVASLRGTPIVPTYHPSYLLRTPHMKRAAWEDLLTVRRLLREPPAPSPWDSSSS